MPGPRSLACLLFVLALALPACGDSDDRMAAPRTQGPVTEATIVGDDLEFDVETLTVPAGQEVTITFENREDLVAHNLRVIAGDEEFKTETETGPKTQTLTFTVAEPGTYEYICDVHPQTMKGELVAV
jgi:plastocyanin